MMKKNVSNSLCLASWILWILAMTASYINYKVSLGCPTGSDSIFGKSGWSLFPPGQTCEWKLESGVTAMSEPQYISLLIPLILILWTVSLYLDSKR